MIDYEPDIMTGFNETDIYGGDNYEEGEDMLGGEFVDVDWAKVIFSILVCIIGLVGNTMTIFVIVILREYKKSVTHWYVLQLAVADTIFLLTLPFKANEDMVNEWKYPVWMCKAKESILFLNYYASILFLMIMSVDRYIAVCHTFSESLQKLRRQFAASVITAVTWLIALLLCTPFAMYSTKAGNEGSCKCEYRFTLAPEPTNYTDLCHRGGVGEEFLAFCLDYASKQTGEARFCKAPKADIMEEFYNSNYSTAIYGGGYGDYGNETDYYGTSVNSSALYDGLNIDIDGITDDMGEYPDSEDLEEEVKFCDYSGTTDTWKAMIYFNFFGMFVIPLMVMVVSYGLIIQRLRTTRVKSNLTQSRKSQQKSTKSRKSLKSLVSGGGSTRKQSSRSDRDRRRVTIMCATLVLSFTLCWVLFHATHLAKMVGIRVPKGNDKYCYTLGAVGALLGYLNSALNPYLYSFLGTNFSRRWGEIRVRMRWLNRGRRQSWTKPKSLARKQLQQQHHSTNATATTNHHQQQQQKLTTTIQKNYNNNTIIGTKQSLITTLAKQPLNSRLRFEEELTGGQPEVGVTTPVPNEKLEIRPKQPSLE